jgi:hypothetical protein
MRKTGMSQRHLSRIFLPDGAISTRPSCALRQTLQSVSSRFPATPKLLGETATTSGWSLSYQSSWDSKAAALRGGRSPFWSQTQDARPARNVLARKSHETLLARVARKWVAHPDREGGCGREPVSATGPARCLQWSHPFSRIWVAFGDNLKSSEPPAPASPATESLVVPISVAGTGWTAWRPTCGP